MRVPPRPTVYLDFSGIHSNITVNTINKTAGKPLDGC
jgi:hypothetical protein